MAQNILIVDDEAAIADTLVYSLTSEGFDCSWVTLGQDALAQLKSAHFDLIILDIGLPDSNGFEICKRIRAFSDVPILFLTARDEEIDRVVSFEIGGDDYVTKPFSPREVCGRVKAILKRGKLQSSHSNHDFELDNQQKQVRLRDQLLPLTSYEFGLLAHFIKHPHTVFSRDQLMDAVWPSPEQSFDRTVDTHIKTLRQKIKQLAPQCDPIITHRGMGYSFQPKAKE